MNELQFVVENVAIEVQDMDWKFLSLAWPEHFRKPLID